MLVVYICPRFASHIRVFDVGPDYELSNGRVFAEGIGDGKLESGGLVDGMKVDERGNVYVTGRDGVWIFVPEGVRLGLIHVPEDVGTSRGAAAIGRSLYIAASTSIYRIRMVVAGNPLPYMR